MAVLQGSLLDLGNEPAVGRVAEGLTRVTLTAGAWVDVRRGWVTGADALFETLVGTVPWQSERRQMYDSVVDVPRLARFYTERETLPHPVLAEAREALSEHYAEELGEPFLTAGMCLYRDGRDSVAWHGDRFGRGREEDTLVAILSLGATRALALRPRGGGESRRFLLANGDLLVMGGSCQRTWDHAVPKTARPVGPRMSVQFRPRAVR
jgi:alkylated DNA repair dioxygenase AlkB